MSGGGDPFLAANLACRAAASGSTISARTCIREGWTYLGRSDMGILILTGEGGLLGGGGNVWAFSGELSIYRGGLIPPSGLRSSVSGGWIGEELMSMSMSMSMGNDGERDTFRGLTKVGTGGSMGGESKRDIGISIGARTGDDSLAWVGAIVSLPCSDVPAGMTVRGLTAASVVDPGAKDEPASSLVGIDAGAVAIVSDALPTVAGDTSDGGAVG